MEIEEIEVNQGPIISDLLYKQADHRSYWVFNNNDWATKQLQCRRSDLKIWNDLVPSIQDNESVWRNLEEMGFNKILRLGFFQLDWGLIQALVERWRPETHTFHFYFGEVTITLQDVELLFGINVDGDAVTGSDEPPPQGWRTYVTDHFGIESPRMRKNRLYLSCLASRIEMPPPEDAGDDWHKKTALCLVAYLFSGFFLADTAQNTIYCHIIRALAEDVDHQLSWGSALLAVLYRNLCKASLIGGGGSVGGCLVLLQIWAWEMIACAQPSVQAALLHPDAPLAARWAQPKNKLHLTSHNLHVYRSQLAMLREDEVCEGYYPDRVVRQLGHVETIPYDGFLNKGEDFNRLHESKRTSKSHDWSVELREFIGHWNDRGRHVYIGEEAPIVAGHPTVSADYFRWFLQRTVKFVANPSHKRVEVAPLGYFGLADHLRFLIDGISDMALLARDLAYQFHNDPVCGPLFSKLEQIGGDTLRLARFGHPPVQPTQSMSQVNPTSQRKRPGRIQQKGGRGGSRPSRDGGHGLSLEDEDDAEADAEVEVEVEVEEEEQEEEPDNYEFLFTTPPETTFDGITTTWLGNEDAGPSQSTPKGRGFRVKHVAYKKKRGKDVDFTSPNPRKTKKR